MNIDIVKNIYVSSFANTTAWEDFLNQLETGLELISHRDELPTQDLAEMKAANIALEYNRELMLSYLGV
ncbi:MAG: hypothetical protein BGO69_06735 [Bacteroidetes bacterium 46-16]|nr:MAG: hypothetical protein BGO69_06735 [Bacteroidetes bacterium 46-16]